MSFKTVEKITELSVIESLRKQIALALLPTKVEVDLRSALAKGEDVCINTMKTTEVGSTKHTRAETAIERILIAQTRLSDSKLEHRRYEFQAVPEAKKLEDAIGSTVSVSVETVEHGDITVTGELVDEASIIQDISRPTNDLGMEVGEMYISPDIDSLQDSGDVSEMIQLHWRIDDGTMLLNRAFECVKQGEVLKPTATNWNFQINQTGGTNDGG